MNEEEKQAIEYLKARLYGNEGCYLIDVAQSDLRIFLNLVEKQQKEIEEIKKEKRILIEKYTDVVNECVERNNKIEYLQKRLYRKGVFSKEKFVRFYPKQYQNEYVKNWVNESDGLTPREMEELGYDVLEECLI